MKIVDPFLRGTSLSLGFDSSRPLPSSSRLTLTRLASTRLSGPFHLDSTLFSTSPQVTARARKGTESATSASLSSSHEQHATLSLLTHTRLPCSPSSTSVFTAERLSSHSTRTNAHYESNNSPHRHFPQTIHHSTHYSLHYTSKPLAGPSPRLVTSRSLLV